MDAEVMKLITARPLSKKEEKDRYKRILEKSNFKFDKKCEMYGFPGEVYKLDFKEL